MKVVLNSNNTAETEPPFLVERDLLVWYDESIQWLTDAYIKCRNEHGDVSP